MMDLEKAKDPVMAVAALQAVTSSDDPVDVATFAIEAIRSEYERSAHLMSVVNSVENLLGQAEEEARFSLAKLDDVLKKFDELDDVLF